MGARELEARAAYLARFLVGGATGGRSFKERRKIYTARGASYLRRLAEGAMARRKKEVDKVDMSLGERPACAHAAAYCPVAGVRAHVRLALYTFMQAS